jgi:hypothetical protein
MGVRALEGAKFTTPDNFTAKVGVGDNLLSFSSF